LNTPVVEASLHYGAGKIRARERAIASDRALKREDRNNSPPKFGGGYIVGGQILRFFCLDLWIKFGKIREKV